MPLLWPWMVLFRFGWGDDLFTLGWPDEDL